MSGSKEKIRVSFVGGNADDVTGSMILIETSKRKILLEAGLFQSNRLREDYQVNTRRLPFKPRELDFIFIGHAHIDHIGLLPRLYREGCTAKVIAPQGTKALFSLLGMDSAYILGRDANYLSKTKGTPIKPVYEACDVERSLTFFEEYPMRKLVKLDDTISFRFVPSGHILGAAQLELWIQEVNRCVKILYTSDLGNVAVEKRFAGTFTPVEQANLVIGETTYAGNRRITSQRTRDKDLEKLRAVVTGTCRVKGGRVLIPVFALDRCQSILSYLFDAFGDDPSFSVPVLIDSPLAQRLTSCYRQLLAEPELACLENALSWANLRMIGSYEESRAWQENGKPCVVLAASGFMTAGRSRSWAMALLPESNSHILFVGYCAENSLGSKIKHAREQDAIPIDGESYPNRCGITDLHSFSGHMQNDDLLHYYSTIHCDQICLVHGDFQRKTTFADALRTRLREECRSTKVVCVNKGTEILL